MEVDKEVYTLYHNDFRLLNGKLLEYYGFTDELRNMLSYFPKQSLIYKRLRPKTLKNSYLMY